MPAYYSEDAYQRAIARRIQQNRRKGGEQRFRAADPELAAQLLDNPSAEVVNAVPDFIWTAISNWGGLTPKQADVARRAITQRAERLQQRAAADAQRASTATPWTAGRYEVSGIIRSAKFDTKHISYNVSAHSIKVTLETESGAKLYVSLPTALMPDADLGQATDEWCRDLRGARLTVTCTVKPKEGDATFAFASRPVKGTLVRAEVAV